MPLSSFDTPWNHQKTTGFSGGIKRDQWHEINWKKTLKSWKKAFISIAYHVMEIHFLFYTFFYWAKHVIDEERKFIQKYSSYSLIFLSKISCFFYYQELELNSFQVNVPFLYSLKVSEKQNINSFQVKCSFLYPLKTSKNLWFSDIFRGYRKEILPSHGLMTFHLNRILTRKCVCKQLTNASWKKKAASKLSLICRVQGI